MQNINKFTEVYIFVPSITIRRKLPYMESRVKEIDYLKCIFITLMIIFHLVYIGDKVTTKKRNAERYSDRIELQGFQSCFLLFVKPSQSPLKPNQDAATLLVRNHARNGDKRTRITKQGVKD